MSQGAIGVHVMVVVIATVAATATATEPPPQVVGFTAPPPVSEGVRADLRAGRTYLRKLEAKVADCGAGQGSGYVVAVLRGQALRFAAPEPIPPEVLRCLVTRTRAAGKPPARHHSSPQEAVAPQREVWFVGGPAPPPQRPADSGGPAGRRTLDEIAAAVAPHQAALGACLEELWEERPHAAGALVLRLTVAEHGGVDEAEVLRHEPSMAAAEGCLLRVAGRFRFPPRWGGGRTFMSYPIVMQGPAPAAGR